MRGKAKHVKLGQGRAKKGMARQRKSRQVRAGDDRERQVREDVAWRVRAGQGWSGG
jgi:hypothetical protein